MDYFLQTQRLGFRRWTEGDEELAASLWGDAEVMRFMGGALGRDAACEKLRQEIRREEGHGFQYWPVFLLATGEFIGCAGLREFHDEVEVLETGVHLARTFWGGRYGEEAGRAVVAYGFQLAGVTALAAAHGPGNVNSKLLMERAGFLYSHDEPWGVAGNLHSYYRLEKVGYLGKAQVLVGTTV